MVDINAPVDPTIVKTEEWKVEHYHILAVEVKWMYYSSHLTVIASAIKKGVMSLSCKVAGAEKSEHSQAEMESITAWK